MMLEAYSAKNLSPTVVPPPEELLQEQQQGQQQEHQKVCGEVLCELCNTGALSCLLQHLAIEHHIHGRAAALYE